MNKLKKLLKKQWFTLVELIIVIAIIAVLAVSAFMMLTKWLGKSRDSRKLADIETASKSLMIWMNDLDNTTGLVPHPDEEWEQLFDGINIFTQWVFGEWVAAQLDNMQKAPINPTTNDYYTYSRTTDGKKYQIATELEDGSEATALIDSVAAWVRVNSIRWNFVPGIYMFDGETEWSKVVIYLPSIVAAVSTGWDIASEQPFVLDGQSENLVESLENIVSYEEVMEEISEPLAILWSGSEGDVGGTEFIETIISNLSWMIVEEITEELVWGMLGVWDIELQPPLPSTCTESSIIYPSWTNIIADTYFTALDNSDGHISPDYDICNNEIYIVVPKIDAWMGLDYDHILGEFWWNDWAVDNAVIFRLNQPKIVSYMNIWFVNSTLTASTIKIYSLDNSNNWILRHTKSPSVTYRNNTFSFPAESSSDTWKIDFNGWETRIDPGTFQIYVE